MPEQPDDTRREYIQLDAIDPDSGRLIKVQLSYGRLRSVASRSMGHALEAGVIVPQILLKPAAIFEGLKQDEDEDRRGVGWRCYCGLPAHGYRADGAEVPPYPRQVYLVFVNQDRVAYNWRWEKADHDDPTLPISHFTRFKRRRL